MKKINNILTHIQTLPVFNKIDTFLEIKRFVNILPLKLKSGIKYVYIKNNTINFVLTHQVFKAEFEYSKDNIKALLKMTNLKDIDKIIFFVSNVIERPRKIEAQVIDEPKYSERSHAIFENRAKNEELFKKFEEIRAIIKAV